MIGPVAHVGGVPLEETLPMLLPVLTVLLGAITMHLRAGGRAIAKARPRWNSRRRV